MHRLETTLLKRVPDFDSKSKEIIFVMRGENFDLDVETKNRISNYYEDEYLFRKKDLENSQ